MSVLSAMIRCWIYWIIKKWQFMGKTQIIPGVNASTLGTILTEVINCQKNKSIKAVPTADVAALKMKIP